MEKSRIKLGDIVRIRIDAISLHGDTRLSPFKSERVAFLDVGEEFIVIDLCENFVSAIQIYNSQRSGFVDIYYLN
jgi:hypothetical protein